MATVMMVVLGVPTKHLVIKQVQKNPFRNPYFEGYLISVYEYF